MKLRINKIRKAVPDQWDAIWRNCDYATYFHSREWAEIWSVSSNGKIVLDPRFIQFSDGKKALIPLSYQKRNLFKYYESSVGGTFGGWISADSLELDHAHLLADHMLREYGELCWLINPYDEMIFKTPHIPWGTRSPKGVLLA